MAKVSNELLRKALTQFSSAALTMQSGDDLERLVVTLWVELSTLGLNLSYCGINTFNEAALQVNFYGVHDRGLLVAERIPFDIISDLKKTLNFFKRGKARRYPLHSKVLLEWLRKIRTLGILIKGPDPQIPFEVTNVLEVPFNFGTIQLTRDLENPFDEETVEVMQSFAQILSFGYARYEDLKKLERQNRELKIGLAVDRVHVEVLAMKRSEDWGKVVNVMHKELLGLAVKFTGCAINIIDLDAQLFRQHIILPSYVRKTFKPKHQFQSIDEDTDLFIVERVMEPGKVPTESAMNAWKEKIVWRRVVEGEELKKIVERSRDTMGFEVSPLDAYPRCLLDIPFSHGLIAMSAAGPYDLTETDELILQQMAQAISVAYSRFLDFQELEKKNRELNETQTQLVQAAKLAAMGQMVAGVAHEINTPLGTINSNFDTTGRALKLIREEIQVLSGGLSEKSRSLFDTIDSLTDLNRLACNRIMRIVRDLKNFARLDEAEFKEANLNDDIESTLTLIQHELKDRIQVIKEFAALPPIRCYPSRLNQVFMNLLINACQSIQGRGEIRIRTSLCNQQVKIAISDTGTGIKEEHLKKIFDPGFTTKGVGVGTGLGLSISARIIHDHRGEIEVESELGKGTTFTISLPINEVRTTYSSAMPSRRRDK
jgi:signal transduction histidine kinase